MRGRVLGDALAARQVGLALIAGLGVDAIQREARRVELGIGHAVLPFPLSIPANRFVQVSRGRCR